MVYNSDADTMHVIYNFISIIRICVHSVEFYILYKSAMI